MKNNFHKKNSAFSLIELSIVILIIGILVAGITQGSSLYRKFKLQTAQKLTRNSPVNGINDLVLWYETSLDESFTSGQNFEGNKISTWVDLSSQNPIKNNATANTGSSCAACPTFKENIINGLPVMRFDGSSDLMRFNGNVLVGADYTVFIVETRRGVDGTWTFFISGTGSDPLHLGYRGCTSGGNGKMIFGGSLLINITCSVDVLRMHTFLFSQAKGVGKKYYLNGGTNNGRSPTYDEAAQTTALSSDLGSVIGAGYGSASNNGYQGDIAEIVIFSHALTYEERRSVESYLSQKYAIPWS